MSVTFETHGAVALITLDRPQALNALDLDSLQALRGHLLQVRDRRELRAAVITGSGERAFCVGADLKSTRDSSASYAEALFLANDAAADAGLYIRQMDLTDLDLHKPLIAASMATASAAAWSWRCNATCASPATAPPSVCPKQWSARSRQSAACID